MKRFITTAMIVLVFTSSSFSQEAEEKKNFAYVGLGTMSIPEIAHRFIDVWITALSTGYTSSDTRGAVPSLTVGYHFYSSERFSAGVSITYEKLRTDIMFGPRNAGTNEVSFISPMAEMRFEYISNQNFGMYMDLGAGACFLSNTAKYDGRDDSATKTTFSAQFTPAGLRFGNKFRVHVGVGFGMKGMLMGSIGMKF